MKYVDGVPEYKGAGDVLMKVALKKMRNMLNTVSFPTKCHFQFQVVKNEGFFSLWKGFTPYYFRLGPHTVLTFIFLEQVTQPKSNVPMPK